MKKPAPNKRSRPLRQYPDGSDHPLSKVQKAALCALAREAFERLKPGGDCVAWRRAEQRRARGIDSLTDATQRDFLPLKKHFAGLANQGGEEYDATYRQPDEAKRQARHLLEQALKERNLLPAYAETICRHQYKRTLDKASAVQLLNLKFTVEARCQKTSQPVEADCPF